MQSSDLRPGPAEAVGIASPEPPTPADIPTPVTPPTPDPQSLLFRTDHLHDDLKGRSVRGGAATLGGQAANFVLKLGSTAVLARLLTPADYGLIAMVTAVTGFVEMFKDAGLSLATVQRAEITHRQVSTLFWFNLGLSFLLMLVVMALAPGVAWFYGEPQLLWITVALGAMFPVGGLTIQHGALLRRQMRFGAIASIDLASNAVGIAAGITAAAFGARYWALVTMMAASGLTGVILTWLTCPWLPGLPVRGSGVRRMFGFGVNLTVGNLCAYFTRTIDNVLIGKCSGTDALGLYAKAYQLLLLPVQQINTPVSAVLFPALCRLQCDREGFRRCYTKALSLIVTLGMLPVAVSFVQARQIVLVVLGEQWSDAVPILYALLPAMAVGTVNVSYGWALLPFGQADRALRLGVCSSVYSSLFIIAGLPWGPLGVASAFSFSEVSKLVPAIAYSFRYTPLVLSDFLAATWRPVVSGGIAISLSMCICKLPQYTSHIQELIIVTAACSVSYLCCVRLLPGGSRQAADIRLAVRASLFGRTTLDHTEPRILEQRASWM